MNTAAALANNLLRSTVNMRFEFMNTLFITHILPIMDYCSCIYNVGNLGDRRLVGKQIGAGSVFTEGWEIEV